MRSSPLLEQILARRFVAPNWHDETQKRSFLAFVHRELATPRMRPVAQAVVIYRGLEKHILARTPLIH